MDDKLAHLRLFFENKGITQEQIAQRFGVTKASINPLLTGKKQFGKKTAQKWAEEFGLSYSWLLTGEGEMFEGLTEKVNGIPYFEDTEAFTAGPLAGTGQAIVASDATGVVSIPTLPVRDGDMAVRARGRSMIDVQHPEQSIPDGAFVVIHPWRENYVQWGEIYCIATLDGYAIKRLQPGSDEEKLKCVSSNEGEGYTPYEVRLEDVRSIAKVTAIINLQIL